MAIEAAAMHPRARQGDARLRDIGNAHTTEEFIRAVKRASHKSAPGKSGISYAELKCCSDTTLALISDLCNVSATSGMPCSSWCHELTYMIPKEVGVDALDKQRPAPSHKGARWEQ